MTPSPRDAAAIFEAALDHPPAKREKFVRRACAGDAALIAEVMGLLAADDEAEGFLEAPAQLAEIVSAVADETPRAESRDEHPDLGRVVGRYRLRELIGRGGMGAVFLGERTEGDFELQVAVKLLRRGMDTDDLLNRFEHERRLLARLSHPNIARLLDGGATDDGRPFLVMEYVDGPSIDVYCEERRLDVRARVELFLDVCEAVQHAHRNLVVHRDLKPSNILVAAGEGPKAPSVVKLLDFGIAKVIDPEDLDTQLTATHVRLLSPRYGSPEQVRGEPISTATDVYSLGVVLYELLTGLSPYADATGALDEIERRVLEQEPTPPSTAITRGGEAQGERAVDAQQLRRTLRGDLDTIVLKSLRKEPERRYSSVDEFAEDLRRHLAGRPVIARPDTLGYRTSKFLRRNALAVTATLIVIAALVTGTVVSTMQTLEATRARRTALEERQTAERVSGFLQDVFASIDPSIAQGEDTTLLRRILAGAGSRIDGELEGHPDVAASLHHTLGRAYHGIGDLERAEHHLERAHVLDPSGPVEHRVDRGAFLAEVGRQEEAQSALEGALERARAAGDVISEGRALYWWGKSLEFQGDYERSLDLIEQAETTLREAGIEEERIPVVNGLATFLMLNRQRFAEADSLYAVAIDLVERTDAGPVQEAQQWEALASSQRRQGNLAVSDSLFARAMNTYLEVIEPEHPQIASLQDSWGGTLETLGDFERAEDLYRASHVGLTKAYGTRHRLVGTVANNLANVLRKQGRYDEAAVYFAECEATYREVLGNEHVWLAIILGNVTLNHIARKDVESSLASATECGRLRRLFWDEDHWQIGIADLVLGESLNLAGRFDEAVPLLLASLDRFDSAFGEESAQSRDALSALRAALEGSGREPRADLRDRL